MLKLKPLSAELQKLAIDELGEVPSRIQQDLEALKKWIETQPHLSARTDDQFLIQFLRGCKFSIERAKEKLDLFYSLKTKYPEMFNVTNVDEEKFRKISQLGCFAALPVPLGGSGPRIIVLQFKKFAATDFTLSDIFHVFTALHEYLLTNDPYACLQGIIYIVDYEATAANQYLQMTPNFAKKLVSYVEKSLPLRLKAVYYINTAQAALHFFKILFPFLSEKIRQRIHVMGHNLDEMYKDIPFKYLPKDYGGEQPSLDEMVLENDKIWDSYREYFKENSNYGVNEKLRPGKPLELDSLFGVDGTFRNLNVD